MNSKPAKIHSSLEKLFRILLWILDLWFFYQLIVIPLAWLFGPLKIHYGYLYLRVSINWERLMRPISIIIVRVLIKKFALYLGFFCSALWEKEWFKKISLSFLSLIIFFTLMENILGMVDFKVSFAPIVFKETPASESHNGPPEAISDNELLWKFNPGTYFAHVMINSLGFRDREINPIKEPGTIRVICLGDSVTGQGRPGYPQYLNSFLKNNPPSNHEWEAINLGVYGYSSVQGEKVFQKVGKTLKPDFVTIYFGWNDHWLHSITDRLVMAREMKHWQAYVVKALRSKKVYQFLVWALDPLQRMRPQADKRVLRVPPEDYKKTLEAIISQVRACGAVPILITAPRNNLTDFLSQRGFARSASEAEKLHDQYIELTRTVAEKTGSDLLDLAAIYSTPEYQKYFASDGIHFDYYSWEGRMDEDPADQPGLRGIGELLYQKISEITQRKDWKANHS